MVGSADPAPSVASSTLSLSMMREAFGGLRRNTERSLTSSTEQRYELERSENLAFGRNRVANAFKEESYSYNSVRESEDFESTMSESRRNNASRSGVASTDFFNYLTAIGGL
jgi:hypothetical protein